MKIRLPIVLAVVPVGFVVGALIVGRPVSVPNDLVLDPGISATTVPVVVTTTAVALPAVTSPAVTSPAVTSPAVTSPTVTSIPAEVVEVDQAARIVVANATATSGIATAAVQALADAGFTDVRPADALPAAVSAVHAREGFAPTATEIVRLLGLPVDAVSAWPDEEITPLDTTADVLVVIGADGSEAG